MKKKLIILLVLVAVLVSYFILQSNKNQKSKSEHLEEYQENIDSLKQENKSLNARLSELQKKKSGNSSDSIISALPENKGIEDFIEGFIKAQYEYSNDDDRVANIKPYVTDDLLELFESEVIESQNKVAYISHVSSIDIYRMDITESVGTAVVYVETTYKVESLNPILNNMLFFIDLVITDSGDYAVQGQSISVLEEVKN